MYVCMYVCMSVFMMYTNICIYVCKYICICSMYLSVYMYVYVLHTYIHTIHTVHTYIHTCMHTHPPDRVDAMYPVMTRWGSFELSRERKPAPKSLRANSFWAPTRNDARFAPDSSQCTVVPIHTYIHTYIHYEVL